MDGSPSPRKKTALLFAIVLTLQLITAMFIASPLKAQDLQTSNQFIVGDVSPQEGYVTVLLPPGHISFDPQLSFFDKSFFTCQIGSSYYSNNNVISFPPNAQFLDHGVTIKITGASGLHNDDTVRTTWVNRNGVDIIQDIYPVAFTKSGQVVYKWKFFNHSSAPITIACQYLQDVQITDQKAAQPNSNDGPIILTRWSYKPVWQQYPSGIQTLPWFYIGFLYNLPNSPSLNPGLSAMGYLEYGDPLDISSSRANKPSRMTIGDWYTMASVLFGQPPGGWPTGSYGAPPQLDNAVLIEFSPQSVRNGQTAELGRTSYGTGEYEKCAGSLFSVVFYPHHLVWKKSNSPPPGYYTPDSIHVEKFVVDADQTNSSANTKITLMVNNSLKITDSAAKVDFGKSQTQPTSGNGIFIPGGGVGYFDWYVRADPQYFCTGSVLDTLTFTATCGICPPGFLDALGDQCDLPLLVDCAENDIDPPEYSDTLDDGCYSKSVNFHDWRSTDRGLRSITYTPQPGTDTNHIKVIGPIPPILPCYDDRVNHLITVIKDPAFPADTLEAGGYDFTFTDCLGHQSFHSVSLKVCPLVVHPDSLQPVFSLIKKWGTYDSTFMCSLGDNNRIDSFQVSDNRINDSGICILDTIPGSVNNMALNKIPFSIGDPIVRFTVSVKDSMRDGNICIRATDCAKPTPHYTDTCLHYCTIKDTLAPRITITKDPSRAGLWHVYVNDDAPWDRHIDSIFMMQPLNVSPVTISPTVTSGLPNVAFDIKTLDTTQLSSFCIEAVDLARNRSKSNIACGSQGIGKDSLCPNILINPLPSTNPTSVIVDVNDIHFLDPPSNKIPYVWDTGVDSVWFTNNHGMNTPLPISGSGINKLPLFPISVRDSVAIDSVGEACVTINASDRKGNICSATYCYRYTQDSLPPVITLWYNQVDHSQILGLITDNTINDRGLASISLFHNMPGIDSNLTLTVITPNGLKVQKMDVPPNVITRDPTRSSVGTLHVLDRMGSLYSSLAAQHTATVDFAIWVQDFKMKPAIQPDQGSVFYVPVYFVKNDSFLVRRKHITDFALSFTLRGDTYSIIFDSASSKGTEMELANWGNPTWIVNGSNVVVKGSMFPGVPPGGTPLASKPLIAAPILTDYADSLVLLYFHANKDQSSRHVTIITDSIQFNNGRDTLYKGSASGGSFSTALMPPPWGSVTGSNIVITGECAPRIQTPENAHPSSVSLDPPIPNPFSHVTTFTYTVASDGPVRLIIYDVLGKEIGRLVDGVQKQGTYRASFDGSNLSGGNYVARLEIGGVVLSRRIAVEK